LGKAIFEFPSFITKKFNEFFLPGKKSIHILAIH